MSHRRIAVIALFVLFSAGTCLAQAQEDDEHAKADAKYFERIKRIADAKAAGPGPLEDVELFLQTAESLVRDRNYRSATGESYRVQSDDPRIDPEAAVALLESFEAFVDERWSGRLELEPFGEQARVFLFYSFHKYNKLLGADFSRSYARPKGHYGTVIDVLAAHTDADFPGGFADVLVHEAAHQLVARRIFAGEMESSPWITEGLAEYFGNTLRTDADGFIEGKIGGKSAGLIRDEREGRAVEPRTMIQRVRRALRERREGSPFAAEVVDIERFGQFYAGAGLNYGTSWLVIHALMHGDDGKHTAGFLAYLERERQGDRGFDVLSETTGLDAAGLDEILRRHIKTLRVH